MKACLQCSSPINPSRTKALYCNASCRNAYHNEQRRAALAAHQAGEFTLESKQWIIRCFREARERVMLHMAETFKLSRAKLEQLERASRE